jgi:hypothetical protein
VKVSHHQVFECFQYGVVEGVPGVNVRKVIGAKTAHPLFDLGH